MTLATTSSPNQNPTLEFRLLAQRYSDWAGKNGIQVRPFRADNQPLHFERMNVGEQALVLNRLHRDLTIFDETKNERESLLDSPKLLWRYLRKSGQTPMSDLFGKICDGDIVSVYDLGQKQIFQNLVFFNWVSLTLDDLFCSAWYQYSRRDPAIEQALYEVSVEMSAGKIRETITPAVDEHLAWEVGTEKLLRFWIPGETHFTGFYERSRKRIYCSESLSLVGRPPESQSEFTIPN